MCTAHNRAGLGCSRQPFLASSAGDPLSMGLSCWGADESPSGPASLLSLVFCRVVSVTGTMTGARNGHNIFMEVKVSMQQSELVGAMEEAPDEPTASAEPRASSLGPPIILYRYCRHQHHGHYHHLLYR